MEVRRRLGTRPERCWLTVLHRDGSWRIISERSIAVKMPELPSKSEKTMNLGCWEAIFAVISSGVAVK